MSLLHVRQIETHLRDSYDQADWDPTLDDLHNLSRLLARFAIDLNLGERAQDGSSLVEITDAPGDRGIDAIAVDPVASLVVVAQSKWRDDGSGSVDLGSVLKFVDGVRALLDLGEPAAGDGDNGSSSDATKAAVRAAMQKPGGRLRMLLATTAANELSEEVKAPIDGLLRVLNDVGDDNQIAEFNYLGQSVLFNSLAEPTRAAIDLDLQLLDWGKTVEPVPAFYGRTSALAIAKWFEAHGSSLFADNIRVVLPKSEINEGIMKTIRDEPTQFWYYNNGITVLSSSVERSLAGAANRDAAFFKAREASVVNGAQTVSTLGRALADGLEKELEQAYVSVRCIEVSPEAPDASDLARRITRYANTQNVVSSQDFVFLDEEQHRLAKELRLLGFEYLLRSGEVPTLRNPDKVIDVRAAAVALACASSLANAVIAKREVSRLFDREAGPYSALFNSSVNGLLVHRAVDVVRAVDAALDLESELNQGTRSGVAVHGNRVIAHLLLSNLGKDNLLDHNFDFDDAMKSTADDAVKRLDALARVFPPNSYPGNVFKNHQRCSELLADAGIA